MWDDISDIVAWVESNYDFDSDTHCLFNQTYSDIEIKSAKSGKYPGIPRMVAKTL
jgi:hypothetical protein